MRRIRPLLAVTALMIAGAAHADVELIQEHTFDAQPGQTVAVDVSLHRVEVEIRPGNTVHAQVEISSSSSSSKAERMVREMAPVFDDEGDTLRIRSRRTGGWSWFNGKVRARVSVTMPPDLDLDVDSSSGSVTIRGDLGRGQVICNASSGSITFDGAARSFDAESSSGSIKATVARPLDDFSAEASSGSVRLTGGCRSATVDTSSGSITLSGLLGNARLSASSGSINAQWDAIPEQAEVSVGASSGSVTLRLPPGTEVAGTARTGSGGIRSDFPGTFDKHSARFSGGADAVKLSLSASSGSVRILAE
jgi:DUF4097 and DUF4098 domain-containing protein YvlB